MTLPTDTHKQSPQRSFSQRWCVRCGETKPTKGGTFRQGLFQCAEHKAKQ